MGTTQDRDARFDAIYDRLKAILEPYAAEFWVSDDRPGSYGLDMAPEADRVPATWFGGVRRRSGCRASRASTSAAKTTPCSPS